MDLFKRIKKILTQPAKFFTDIRKEKGLGNAFVYLSILALFAVVLGSIIGYFMQPFMLSLWTKMLGFELPENIMMQYSFFLFFIFALIGYGVTLLLSFVWAGILHVWILIFGGKGDYIETFKLSVYSRTPSFILGWIPFVGYVIWIWSLVLLIIGTQKMHQISRLRAILMYLIPVIAFIILMIGSLILMAFLFRQVDLAALQTLS
jgi:hypothetical protein